MVFFFLYNSYLFEAFLADPRSPLFEAFLADPRSPLNVDVFAFSRREIKNFAPKTIFYYLHFRLTVYKPRRFLSPAFPLHNL